MSKLAERKVYFPRERRRVWLGARAKLRARWVAAAAVVLLALAFIRSREERAAAIRATRAAIGSTWSATLAYRAEHRTECPKDVGELQTGGYLKRVPVDAWGRPLRLVCPGRKDPAGFEVLSDGPDGLPYGLDRVE